MRALKLIFLVVAAILLIVIALANAETVTVRVLPDTLARFMGTSWMVSLPMFAVILGAVVLGVLIGMAAEFTREHKYRVAARTERRERKALEREMDGLRASGKARRGKGDEIVALLEDGSVPQRKAS